MANKDNLSVFGKGTKVDVDVKNQSVTLRGQDDIFADSHGGKGGGLTRVSNEGEQLGGCAAKSGGNNRSGWGHVHSSISLFFGF